MSISKLHIVLPYSFLFLGVFFFLFFPLSALASTLLIDDFNSYSSGNLTGQGSWLGDGGSSFQVEATKTYEGTNAVYCAGANDCKNYKVGTQTPSGSEGFFVYPETGAVIWAYFREGGTDKFIIFTSATNKEVWALTNNGATWVLLGNYSANDQWFYIRVEWQDDTHLYRVAWEDEGWSDWLDNEKTWSYIDEFKIRKSVSGNGYIDDLGGDSPCDFWQSANLCQINGCMWEYSNFSDVWVSGTYSSGYCVDMPSDTECGNTWETCPFCLTETDCTSQLGCFWQSDETCTYGTGACAAGYDVVFCDNQTDCENNGGYWADSFCSVAVAPSGDESDISNSFLNKWYYSLLQIKDKAPFVYAVHTLEWLFTLDYEEGSSVAPQLDFTAVLPNAELVDAIDFRFASETAVALGGESQNTFGWFRMLLNMALLFSLVPFSFWIVKQLIE